MGDIITDANLDRALINELCSGRMRNQVMEQKRAEDASRESFLDRNHKTISGLGKCVLNIPQHEFFTMREKYGPDAFADKGFIRDIQRLEPSLKVHNL